MTLKNYHHKRNFKKTPEPKGKLVRAKEHLYIIQKHAASHLHYDFRLELNGVLLSWAVPKGPCYDPTVKRLAMHVEDHPVAYGSFEGIIPKGQYGGGTVMLWDKGYWEPLDDNPKKAYQEGHLRFVLHAEKLKGRWDLLRFKDDKHWFLIKYADEYAAKLTEFDVTLAEPDSVMSKQTLDEIAKQQNRVWNSDAGKGINLPEGLSKAPFPDFIKPQLATLVDRAPTGSQWLHELKFDGYRMLAFVKGKKVSLKSRNNKDWTAELQPLAQALTELQFKNLIFDGEVVLLNAQGKSDFQLLQNAIKSAAGAPFVYYVFDILYYDGFDLKPLPLVQRKELLQQVLPKDHSDIRYSDHIIGNGADIFKKTCELSLEGIISKRAEAAYINKRSAAWLKIKCSKRQEFIICGYSQPKGARDNFGALYLGFFIALAP